MHDNVLEEVELSDVTVEDLIGEIFTKKLVVFNDDVNSFEWVIECFMKYLKFPLEQAEQCAMLIHNRGKYAVKDGTEEDLRPIKEALDDAGLSCEIQ